VKGFRGAFFFVSTLFWFSFFMKITISGCFYPNKPLLMVPRPFFHQPEIVRLDLGFKQRKKTILTFSFHPVDPSYGLYRGLI